MNEHEFSPTHPLFPFAPSDAGSSATYLHALIEHSPLAIVALDAQHRGTLCNLAFERLFQYTSEDLFAADFDQLIASPERHDEASRLSQRVLQGEKVHTFTQRRRRDGMAVDVELFGIPLVIDGELAGVYGLYQDVTERNRVQVAFRSISDQMANLQQERIARDLHDPTAEQLTALNGNLTRLNTLVADQDEALKTLVQQTRTLASQCYSRIRAALPAPPPQTPITGREREVMRLLAEGRTSREAAMILEISVRTLESHRLNISRKLGLHSIAGLVRYAILHGIAPHACAGKQIGHATSRASGEQRSRRRVEGSAD